MSAKHQHPHTGKRSKLASAVTMVICVILVVIKAIAWLLTNSPTVLAVLLDSIADTVISATNFWAIRYSLKPADYDHRYGHGKIEGVVALFQAALLGGAAAFILFEVGFQSIHRHAAEANMMAIGLIGLSLLLNLIIVSVQRHAIKKEGSLALEADSAHYSGDILLHLGALGALASHYLNGPAWIDMVFAVMAAAYLGYAAKDVWGKALDMLMDREISPEDREAILSIIHNHKDVLSMHDLRTRRAGNMISISFDIELDPNLSLITAHDIAQDVEKQIMIQYPNAEVLIHTDPKGSEPDARHKVEGVHDI